MNTKVLNRTSFFAVLAVAAFLWHGTQAACPGAETENAPSVTLSADFSQTIGKIKPVNGTNLGPRLVTSRYNEQQKLFNDAHFGLVRLHDAPWDNPTLRLVDVHYIFGNMNDDPADPANYYFAATDDYIKSILDGGAPIMYRLGVSIEHSAPNTYFAKEPKDCEKMAEIFAGIVRHYNRGWAEGFHYGIAYWEIWNEPDMVPLMWDNSDFASYCRFYAVAAKRLKQEFPQIKVGGPALAGCNQALLAQFIDYCRQEDAPLDFCSWHTYPSSLAELLDAPAIVRSLLDERGYTHTELHLDEWHYFNCSWDTIMGYEGGREYRREVVFGDSGINGSDAAAFIICALIGWQETPIDSANYYCTALMEDEWGLIDSHGYPFKTYYAYKAFGEMAAQTPSRAVCEKAPENFAILAGQGENGARRILAASFKENASSLKIRLAGVPESGTVRVTSIESGEQIEPAESELPYSGGILDLGAVSGSTVKIIDFVPDAQ